MTSVFESLGVGHLDWHAKADLLERLQCEFQELPRPPISPEFLKELERRSEHHRLHPEDSVSWDEVYAEILKENGE